MLFDLELRSGGDSELTSSCKQNGCPAASTKDDDDCAAVADGCDRFVDAERKPVSQCLSFSTCGRELTEPPAEARAGPQ